MIKIAFQLLLVPIVINGDCGTYDYMHTSGGSTDPCPYTPNIVHTVTVGDGNTYAFGVDGAHLQSQGAMSYIKSINEPPLSPTEHLQCGPTGCGQTTISL